MSIPYGKGIELPDSMYTTAIDCCRVDPDGHWIWYGSVNKSSGHPQIGAVSLVNGEKKLKVVSVQKLIFVVKNKLDFLPYQVRRNKKVCVNPLCVNPDHFYLIAERPVKEGKD